MFGSFSAQITIHASAANIATSIAKLIALTPPTDLPTALRQFEFRRVRVFRGSADLPLSLGGTGRTYKTLTATDSVEDFDGGTTANNISLHDIFVNAAGAVTFTIACESS